MFFLRLLAILNGGVVLVAAPLYLRHSGLHAADLDNVVLDILLLAVIVGSFFFVGLTGHRMRKSAGLRTLGGMLLAVPFVTSVALVADTRSQEAVYLCVAMFCMAAVLFVSFIYPGSQVRKHRPMRPREHVDGYLELPGRT